MDENNDRAVSGGELDSGLSSEWEFADSDANGSLSAIEFGRWADASLGSQDTLPNRLALDSDLSGSVSEAEFTDAMTLEFNRLDTNNDQILTRAELLFVRPARAPQSGSGQRQRPSGGRGGGSGGRGGGRGGRGG